MTIEQFGRYQIKSELGRGGMATVYLAHDPRFGRDVALKVLSVAYRDDPTFRGRFEREARTIATLEHRAIVPVYDFGEDNEQLYLVMRYMPGGTLLDRIVMKPFTLVEAAPIIRRIASSLDHAHEHGVIHRDLKPANVLFDQYNNAFLSDFGIVKLAGGTTTGLTGSGVIGTPAYMSPEQIHGDQEIDGRSDIYTLGIILFEMLTGFKPYRADTPVKQMMAHVLNPIPNIRKYNPLLPRNCESMIQKALAKERVDRFATAEALHEALTMTASGQGIELLANKSGADVVERDETAVSDFQSAETIIRQPDEFYHDALQPVEDEPTSPSLINQPRSSQRGRWFAGLGIVAVLLLMLFVVPRLFEEEDPIVSTATARSPVVVLLDEPTQTATATATVVSTVTATGTAVPTINEPQQIEIGTSVNGTSINATQFGEGEQIVLFVGGLQGGWAPGAVAIAERLMAALIEDPSLVPANLAVVIVPNLNPDSEALSGELNGRLNANGVDLNRNWDCRWRSDPVWQGVPAAGLGGDAPFSEPEVVALRDFIEQVTPVGVIFWQARVTGGLVSPGGCQAQPQASTELSTVYGGAVGYTIADFESLVNQEVNGDSTNWLDEQGIPAISVLLPTYDDADWENNLAGAMAVFQLYADDGAVSE
ncbi:MAG: protein kinase [Chloroflexi bacterium]|nr:protein kinase [Chloroflexota bacterium]